ncbi:hypothetical protein CAEBREN_25976 [Caenorhabditis brenneri]|uniref:Sdz-33 F-box domain-containing protein n=1 Tax=Caenorhabditis brenneri TaxID=135651 RepID=G0N0I6_CAEBE|nr:hypothetical protein CAEBREN_25976 [Caenorhabditis brenneri]
MAQEPTHPLLSLPDDEIFEKIREMRFEEVIEFSLISEKTKNLVKSAKLQGTDFQVEISSEVEIHFDIKKRKWERNFLKIDSTNRPSEVRISSSEKPRLQEKTIWRDQCGLEDWKEHLCTIFNLRSTNYIRFGGSSDEYDPVVIKKCFGVPSRLIITTESYNHTLAILQTFLPVEHLNINSNVFRNSIKPKILIQNFKSLIIDKVLPEHPEVVTLDDLLMTNSKQICIGNARLGPKDINKFIKLWQHGANPRMEYLSIGCDLGDGGDHETALKGINCTEVPNSERRWFKFGIEAKKPVRGGKNIWRTDGVKATIQLYENYCQVYVWFDHCICSEEPTSDNH